MTAKPTPSARRVGYLASHRVGAPDDVHESDLVCEVGGNLYLYRGTESGTADGWVFLSESYRAFIEWDDELPKQPTQEEPRSEA